MISSAHRFHGHASLTYVYRNGNSVRGPLCSLKFAVNKKRTDYRLAVVVSKKVSKSAVVRNRIRRRLYESVRRQENSIGNVDMVFTVFGEGLATISAGEVDRLVVAQLKQAEILQ